ncbi:MAG: hypothetical protein A3H27_01415 [Acidobacteria bacterium RIFCSPLOWO2_02_FULL_59_13]|nr:MAG: hypothetical protein A3H27_01415 [Acidobacteria bacterium RIFCSPLOWO2_02_FULL_59_13]
MATRGRTSFQKRQKEMARKEKRQIKAERRMQRKLTPGDTGDAIAWDEANLPEDETTLAEEGETTPEELDPESESREV